MKLIDLKKPKKILILATILLIISSVSIGSISYNYSKKNMIKNLELANYRVTKFDIIDTIDDEMLIEGELSISEFNSRSLSPITPLNLQINLYNQTEFVGRTSFSLKNHKISKHQTFVAKIPINKNSKTFENLFVNLLKGIDFELTFSGILRYKIGMIYDEIEFTDSITFDLDQDPMQFKLFNIDLPPKNEKSGSLEFGIFNPFTARLDITGEASLLVENYVFGKINMVNQLKLQSGWNNITHDILLIDLPLDALHNVFDSFNDEILLVADLEVSINKTSIDLAIDLQIIDNNDLFDISIDSITDIIVDSTAIVINFDILLKSNIPIDLNISSISMQLETLSGSYLGVVFWNSSIVHTLAPLKITAINNITARFENISIYSIIQVITDGAIKISNGIIELLVFAEVIYYEFSIDQIDLT